MNTIIILTIMRWEKMPNTADLPPLKWSSLRYYFAMKEDDDGKEETHSGRDHREVTAS